MPDSELIDDLFLKATSLPRSQWTAFVQSCSPDESVRARLAVLLQAHDAAQGFLETPAIPPPTADTAALTESPGTVIDRYKLLQLIGEGGFGTVWMAEQKVPVKRRVALKIIKLGMDTKQVIARFEAERQALALMNHPNIAKVLDAGATDTGRPYFVMEYVRGVGILEYCDTEKLDTAARLGLFIKVCNAIQHAHQKGIIHRDIKPSNVMVTLHDGVPVPKVIDFGVAKATNTELTQKTLFTEHRQMIGTPAYMSPEQAEMSGLDIDTRSDIYALGVLLYELLTGTTPFDSRELMSKGFAEMMRIIREQEPHKPSTRLSTLGETASRTAGLRRADPRKLGHLLRGDLDWIVMKCLEKDRTRRYETANGLAADIRRHLDDEPVVAGPPGTTYRVRKFLHRNRAAVGVAAMVVVFLLGGLSLALLGLSRAQLERDRAWEAQQQALQAQSAAAAERDRALEAERHALAAEREADAERDRAQELEQRAHLLRRLFAREQLSLAVLPLGNASGDPDQAYFATGMTRALINDLRQIDAIDVRSFDSVAKFVNSRRSHREIARDLGVDLLLKGSVLRVGDRVQITMTLDHEAEQLNLWAETYTGEWSNVLDIQRQVSEDTVRAVQVQWTSQDRQRLARRDTDNPQAREAYFKGAHNLRAADKADLERAIEFFDEAITLDPEYALAYLGKARALIGMSTLGVRPDQYNPPAKAAAQQALALDDTLAGAWAVLGMVQLQFELEWDRARESFERALELEPDHPQTHVGIAGYYVTIGEFELAIEHLKRAIQIDPAVVLLNEDALYIPFFARRLDVTVELCRYALDLDKDYWSPHAWMGLALAWQGDTKAGLASAETAYALRPESPIGLALLASTYAMDGQMDMAEQRLEELLDWADANYVCPYEIATVFVAMGDRVSAYEFLDRAVVAQSECVPFMGVDMRMDELRDEPDFQQIMRGINHPLYGKPRPWETPESPAEDDPI